MKRVALLLGVLVAVQGLFGLAFPDAFVQFVRLFQTSPVIYAAAAVRVAFGAVLVRAASQSRAPIALGGLGVLIVLGGLATPFLGAQFAREILAWWAEGGAPVVRGWASASLAIGLFIVYATFPGRHLPDPSLKPTASKGDL